VFKSLVSSIHCALFHRLVAARFAILKPAHNKKATPVCRRYLGSGTPPLDRLYRVASGRFGHHGPTELGSSEEIAINEGSTKEIWKERKGGGKEWEPIENTVSPTPPPPGGQRTRARASGAPAVNKPDRGSTWWR